MDELGDLLYPGMQVAFYNILVGDGIAITAAYKRRDDAWEQSYTCDFMEEEMKEGLRSLKKNFDSQNFTSVRRNI